MVTFDMVEHKGLIFKNISTLKADMFTLVKDDMVKMAFTVIFTIVWEISTRLEVFVMGFLAMGV